MCDHPTVHCEEEIAPKAYHFGISAHDKNNAVQVSRETQVLNKGTRLIVELSRDIKSILENEGMKLIYWGIEVDKTLPNGATTEDIIKYRSALSNSPVWKFVAKELGNRFPTYGGKPYTTAKLESFDDSTSCARMTKIRQPGLVQGRAMPCEVSWVPRF